MCHDPTLRGNRSLLHGRRMVKHYQQTNPQYTRDRQKHVRHCKFHGDRDAHTGPRLFENVFSCRMDGTCKVGFPIIQEQLSWVR